MIDKRHLVATTPVELTYREINSKLAALKKQQKEETDAILFHVKTTIALLIVNYAAIIAGCIVATRYF